MIIRLVEAGLLGALDPLDRGLILFAGGRLFPIMGEATEPRARLLGGLF